MYSQKNLSYESICTFPRTKLQIFITKWMLVDSGGMADEFLSETSAGKLRKKLKVVKLKVGKSVIPSGPWMSTHFSVRIRTRGICSATFSHRKPQLWAEPIPPLASK